MHLYRADRVLARTDEPALTDAAVLVDGDRIGWVGPAAGLPAAYAEVGATDLGDATILAGLVDAHVHLGFDGGPAPVNRLRSESDALQTALMLRSARRLLSTGVTTVRDLGGRGYLTNDVRDAIAAGTARGPRVLTAGSPITTTGGHCWWLGGEADGVDEIRKLVRTHHRAGVDLIKVMATGGFMTAGSAPWYPQFTEHELAVIVEEAHRFEHPVAAHAHGVSGIERALAAGVDTIEHCSFVQPDGTRDVVPELADRIAAAGTFVSVTLGYHLPELEAMTDRLIRSPLPGLLAHGCRIVASTDCGIDETPHHGFAASLVAMADYGMTPAQALTSATLTAAEALRLPDEIGRLAPGLAADLIAVGGDPLDDIGAIADLRLVVAGARSSPPTRCHRSNRTIPTGCPNSSVRWSPGPAGRSSHPPDPLRTANSSLHTVLRMRRGVGCAEWDAGRRRGENG